MESRSPGRSVKLKWILFTFLILTVAFSFWMRTFLSPLESRDIIEFEIAKTPERATAILEEWQLNGKLPMAMKSIYADYFFILLYTITISSACLYFSRICGNLLFRQTGKFFSVLVFVAGIFDVVENLAMTRTLSGELTVNMVSLTYKMAISKFSIILMSLFFVGICIISWIAGTLEHKKLHADLSRQWEE